MTLSPVPSCRSEDGRGRLLSLPRTGHTPRAVPVITQSSCRPNSTPEKRLISPLQNPNPASPLAHTRPWVHRASCVDTRVTFLFSSLQGDRSCIHPKLLVLTPGLPLPLGFRAARSHVTADTVLPGPMALLGRRRVAQTESDFCVLPGRGTAAGLSCAETTRQTPMWSWESQAGG